MAIDRLIQAKKSNRFETENEAIDIIIPAAITPAEIEGREYLKRMSKSDAIIAPVHAPVPGRGIATKRKRPKAAFFITLSAFLVTRFSIL